jgi:CubicO group peptidase (beta-lactamase class C family)
VVFAWAALPLAAARLAETAPTTDERIDEIFSELDEKGSPGAAVVVVRGGNVLFQGAYGHADLKKAILVETDTAFYMASAAKQMTAVAVLQLSERGKLALADPVVRFLPEFRGWGEGVTILHLLQHTAGLPDTDTALGDRPGEPNNADTLKLLAQWKRLDFRPGARQQFGNTGYEVLASIVEKVAGKSFGAVLEESVFGPTGMKDTFVWDEERRAKAKRALGYSQQKGAWTVDDDSSLNRLQGAGSLYTTVEDLARYDKALFGRRLLNEASLAAMFRPGRLGRLDEGGQPIPYGLGWYIDHEEESGRLYYGCSGAWMGFTSYYLHLPQQDLSVIVLANSSETDAEGLAFETAEVFR